MTAAPVEVSDHPAVTLRELTQYLEDVTAELEQNRFPREDATDGRPQFVFPGVANIILGVFTGDLRRIVENGAFHFLTKGARDQALAVYNNLLGQKPTTKVKKSTTAAVTEGTSSTVSSTSTTEEPDDLEESTTEDPEEAETTVGKTRRPAHGHRRRSRSTTTVGTTTAATAAPEIDEEEEEIIVARFEQALLPFLPKDPQEAVIQEYPEFV